MTTPTLGAGDGHRLLAGIFTPGGHPQDAVCFVSTDRGIHWAPFARLSNVGDMSPILAGAVATSRGIIAPVPRASSASPAAWRLGMRSSFWILERGVDDPHR